jgi:hypothetical protein
MEEMLMSVVGKVHYIQRIHLENVALSASLLLFIAAVFTPDEVELSAWPK